MRSVLVFNPFATSTSDVTKNQIFERLRDEFKVTLEPTSSRGEATAIATRAIAQGVDVVIGYGGDGTMNELANGLLHAGPQTSGPILGAIPGGNANVFARNLEFSTDPIQATEQLIDSMKSNQVKTIGVGKLSTNNLIRWFLFNSGFGIDAAVLAKMEERRQSGKKATDNRYTVIAMQELLAATTQRDVSISLETSDDKKFENLQFALVINLAPWIYIGSRPIALTPEATFENALSVYAPADLSVPGLLHLARNLVSKKAPVTNSHQIALTDQAKVTFTSEKPLWVQVDGEVLAQVKEVSMLHVPDALRVFV